MESRQGRSNRATFFGVEAAPCDSQLRARLEALPYDAARGLLPKFFERMRRAGWARQFRATSTSGAHASQYYVMPLDGADYFHATQPHGPNGFAATDKSGVTHCRHVAVAATRGKPKSRFRWPLDAELCVPQDGHEKPSLACRKALRCVTQ